MRNPQKILHLLLMWGMVPLILWSGFPTLGCACASASSGPATCRCCCALEKDSAKKGCCCRGEAEADKPAPISIQADILPFDLGLLATCGCGRTPTRSPVTLESQRKSVGEDLVAKQEDDDFAAADPVPPLIKEVVESWTLIDSDRVVLFCAFLI